MFSKMPRKKKQKKEKVEKVEKVKKITRADIFNKDGNYVRTYDIETHGENFKEMAHEYAKKIGGKVK